MPVICIGAMNRGQQEEKPTEAGYILVYVLAAVALLGALATAMVARGYEAGKIAQLERARLEGQYLADGLIYQQIAGILDGSQTIPSRGSVTIDPQYSAAYDVRSTSGKLDLNRAETALMTAVFAEVGASNPGQIVAAILDWRDRDSDISPGGAERPDYARQQLVGPANRPFSDPRELAYVLGVSREVYDQVADHITVWGTRRIDSGSATDLLSRASARLSAADAARLIRSGQNAFAAPLEIAVQLEHQSGSMVRRRAIIRLLPGQSPPYLIIAWDSGAQ